MKSDVLDGIVITNDAVSEIKGKSYTIKHYGVKGMRWGVRRDLDDLSNEELKSYVERIRLEKQFAELTHQPTVLEAGAKFVSKYGTKAVGNVLADALSAALKKQLKMK